LLTCIKGGRVVDPANQRDGVGDVWIRDGRIIEPPDQEARADEIYDAAEKLVLAGAIDIHSHIAGESVNAARLLVPGLIAPGAAPNGPLERAPSSAFLTGCRYAAMGFTTVVEPAVSPQAALQAHLDLADVPIIDKAILAVLGNDSFLLDVLRRKEGRAIVGDYVSFTLGTARGLGIKAINPGGSAAFKANARAFSLDDVVPFYGASSREIFKALQRGVVDAGVPHPLHLHCNNLGLAGNAETALATIAAGEGMPLHLAHLQFYGYGKSGPRGFSSDAPRLAEAVNAAENLTVDVGQVMFGQTVTISLDVLRQFNSRVQASPRKWLMLEREGNGFGIVPYHYRPQNYYNALQWAVGLELFLLIAAPDRVFFTTDHPNGAPFTTYPELFALLMDRDFRNEWLARLPLEVLEVTTLGSIEREYSINEIATMTRAAPAKLLGLSDRGHLGVGAVADVAVYSPSRDRARMFRAAAAVFKDGELVVRDGQVTRVHWGRALFVRPGHDRTFDRRIGAYCEERYGLSPDFMKVPDAAIHRPEPFEVVPCRH
jgi:formylmethanofuran dehydrogenase subunit A